MSTRPACTLAGNHVQRLKEADKEGNGQRAQTAKRQDKVSCLRRDKEAFIVRNDGPLYRNCGLNRFYVALLPTSIEIQDPRDRQGYSPEKAEKVL